MSCTNKDLFTQEKYTSKDAKITSVIVDVRDRDIEVRLSQDNQIHINYFESEKEFYDISVSDGNVLTMSALTNKKWKDYIGKSPVVDVRKISIEIPNSLLTSLVLSTTNKDMILSELTVLDDIILSSNGGNITFGKLDVGSMLKITAKNGNIKGAIAGGYDDFSIDSKIKKGKNNLPALKKDGDKKLEVANNNGNIEIEFIRN